MKNRQTIALIALNVAILPWTWVYVKRGSDWHMLLVDVLVFLTTLTWVMMGLVVLPRKLREWRERLDYSPPNPGA